MARGDDEQAWRVRLEGAAELLEAHATRLRGLNALLGGVFWRARLEGNGELISALERDEASLPEALERTRRLGRELEGPRELAARCEELRREAYAALQRRTDSDDEDFLSLYARLRDEVAEVPAAWVGEQWRAARRVLASGAPELLELQRLAARVGRLATTRREEGPLRWTEEEVELLAESLPALDRLKAAQWRRLLEAPDGDELEPALLSVVARRVRALPDDGPGKLVAAELASRDGWEAVEAEVSARLAPVSAQPYELLGLLRWFARGAPESLPPQPSITPARAALLSLAFALSRRRPLDDAGWERLLGLARTVEAGRPDPEADRLADNLRLFARIKAGSSRGPPERGLVAALLLLRRMREE